MSAEPKDVVYQVAFQCPRCKATLQIQAQPASSWVRCPKCGRASLAPDPVVRRAPEPIRPEDNALVLGPVPEFKPMTPVAVAGAFEQRGAKIADEREVLPPPANPLRVAAGAGFCVATILCIFSALESYDVGLIIFSILGVLCIIPLLRIPVES
jgi:hypothetical protein